MCSVTVVLKPQVLFTYVCRVCPLMTILQNLSSWMVYADL